MNRLQKKCLVATAGFHLLLVLTIIFGSAFFTSHQKPDETQVLDVIPANLIDAAFNSGVKAAQPPAPTPIVQPPAPQPTPPQPTPPPPKPVVTPPTLVDEVKNFFKPEPKQLSPDALEPVEKPAKPAPKKMEISLTPVVRNVPKVSPDTSDADAREAAKEAKRRAKAIAAAARAIKANATSATEVDMPGNSSVAYANYDQAILSIYDQAWISPEGMTSGEAVVKVRVVVSRDGTVISARIIDASGNSKMDDSVQQTLDRVTQLRPFPEGTTEQQRTIEFNFKTRAKPLLG